MKAKNMVEVESQVVSHIEVEEIIAK